jgi:hypothetical protein
MLEPLCGHPSNSFVVYHRDMGIPDSQPVKLKYLDKMLTAYNIHDGDEFIMENKVASPQLSYSQGSFDEDPFPSF